MTTTTMTPVTAAGSRRFAGLAILTVLAMVLSGLVAPPAHAFSAYCGEDAIGVGNNYVSGRDNGHPLDEATNLDGWAGREAERNAGVTALSLDRSVEALQISLDILDAASDDAIVGGLGFKIALAAGVVARTALNIAKAAADVALLDIQLRNARVDSCGGLAGDMSDALFVALMEEELAYLDLDGSAVTASGQARGTRRVPTAMYLLPQDGMPAWQRDAHLYTTYGNHASLGITYPDGVLNSPYIGVAETVRNQIAYLMASNIYVANAGDLWLDAMTVLEGGDVRRAYQLFAQAYRTAVEAVPDPGAPTDPSGNPATPPPPAPPPAPPAPPPAPPPPPPDDGGGGGTPDDPWENSGEPSEDPSPPPPDWP